MLTFNAAVWGLERRLRGGVHITLSGLSVQCLALTQRGSQMPLTPAPIGPTLSSVFGKHLAPLGHTLHKVTHIGKQKSNINHEVG